MFKNAFKAGPDARALVELRASPAFKIFVEKLTAERNRGYQDVLVCPAVDLPDRRAYLRALDNILSVISG